MPRKSAKICPKLTKHPNGMTDISGSPAVKQTLICRADVPLIFKNVGRRKEKRSIINVNLNVALTT